MSYPKKAKLETVFLMSIVPHFISLNMLMRFHQVSKSCGEAISRLKINPCFQELSLETVLQNDHSIQLKKELQVFTGIDTLHTSIETLQNLPLELLEKVKLFEISFVQRSNPTSFPIWNTIKERISRMEIEVQVIPYINFLELKNLRRLEIKAGRNKLQDELAVLDMDSIRVIVVHCDGFLYRYYYEMLEKYVSGKLRILYKLNWMNDEDFDDIASLCPRDIVSIYLNELPPRITDYIKTKTVLLYYQKKEFRIPIDVFLSNDFNNLMQSYYPSMLDVRGDIRNESDHDIIVDLQQIESIEEITFNFVTTSQKISIIFPSSLKKLSLYESDIIKDGGLLQLNKTQLSKEMIQSFENLVGDN